MYYASLSVQMVFHRSESHHVFRLLYLIFAFFLSIPQHRVAMISEASVKQRRCQTIKKGSAKLYVNVASRYLIYFETETIQLAQIIYLARGANQTLSWLRSPSVLFPPLSFFDYYC